MTLQERLAIQEQELYINEISKGEIEDMAQEESKGNVVALRAVEAAPMDIVPSFAISMAEAKARVELLQEFVREMMIEGSDYGYIPGCGSKPSLLKPGAEKLCDIFGFSKSVQVVNRMEDWDNGVFAYEVKAVLTNKRTGLVEAEGIGCCNSREKKYIQQDSYSIANTILKMAKKRALVDAVLSATRSSGLFTQDIEDLEVVQEQVTKPVVKTQAQIPAPRNTQIKMSTDPQRKKIFYMTLEMGMSATTVKQLLKDRYNVGSSEELTSKQASDFINHLILLQG